MKEVLGACVLVPMAVILLGCGNTRSEEKVGAIVDLVCQADVRSLDDCDAWVGRLQRSSSEVFSFLIKEKLLADKIMRIIAYENQEVKITYKKHEDTLDASPEAVLVGVDIVYKPPSIMTLAI